MTLTIHYLPFYFILMLVVKGDGEVLYIRRNETT